jgi:hypothetical protein
MTTKLDKKIKKLLKAIYRLKKKTKPKPKQKGRTKPVINKKDIVAEYAKNQLLNTIRPTTQTSLIANDAKKALQEIEEENKRNIKKDLEEQRIKTGDRLNDLTYKTNELMGRVNENSRNLSNLEQVKNSMVRDQVQARNPREDRDKPRLFIEEIENSPEVKRLTFITDQLENDIDEKEQEDGVDPRIIAGMRAELERVYQEKTTIMQNMQRDELARQMQEHQAELQQQAEEFDSRIATAAEEKVRAKNVEKARKSAETRAKNQATAAQKALDAREELKRQEAEEARLAGIAKDIERRKKIDADKAEREKQNKALMEAERKPSSAAAGIGKPSRIPTMSAAATSKNGK